MTDPSTDPSKDRPALSEGELSLLKALWDRGASTVRDLHGTVGGEWAYTTVQTMLTRMVEKGYVTVDRESYAHRFAAAVSRDSLLEERLAELQDELCDEGAAASLLLHLAEGRDFTREEIARFRAILDQAEQRAKEGGAP